MVNVATTTEVGFNIHRMGLNSKQKQFVIHYAGDATAACKIAGYKPDGVGRYGHHAKRLMKNPDIIKAIKRRDEILKNLPNSTDPVLSVEELRQWWTQIIADTKEGIGHRITCSKLLAQSYGAFIERVIIDEHKEIDVTYSFAGPKSAFLESREKASMIEAEVKTLPTPSADDLADIL